MPWTKGKSGNPAGRKKGVPNKITGQLIEEIRVIHEILEKKGKGLKDCAKKDPEWFYTNFVKLLIPKSLELDMSMDMNIKEDVRIILVDAASQSIKNITPKKIAND